MPIDADGQRRATLTLSAEKRKRRCSRATTHSPIAYILDPERLAYAPRLHILQEPKANWMPIVVNQQKFFLRLGERIRELRTKRGHSQEDMISFGFSARHWQQIEAGRPITVSTLLRVCAAFGTSIDRLVRGLDRGIYEG